MKGALALAIALSATGAAAQTTSCGMEFGKWVCRSRPAQAQPNFMGAFMQGRQAGQAAAQDREAERARLNAEARAANDAAARSRVAGMVRDGDCAGAKDLALALGDLTMAQQAVSLCVPKP